MIPEVEGALGTRVLDSSAARGGCIANARVLSLEDGRTAFAKMVAGSSPFVAEGACLEALHVSSGVRVPQVWHAAPDLLILEYIHSAAPVPDFMEVFGRQLAVTHRREADAYGFSLNHVIGATPQRNLPRLLDADGAWAEFWWEYRMAPMIHFVEKRGDMTPRLRKNLLRLESRLPGLVNGTGERPSLLHGDLWSGNTMPDEHGMPVMFDPASYYGHREADLSMTRMFGGFSTEFYHAYHEEYPLEDGWEQRLDLYMLYHILNHVVLFGGTYLRQAEQVSGYFSG